MKSLGKRQIMVLSSLVEYGYWHARCGWTWDTHSSTERILQSLQERGLALLRREEWPIGSGCMRSVYRPTAVGRRVNSESGGAS